MASTAVPTASMRDRMTTFVTDLQQKVIDAIESVDPAHSFLHDSWQRPKGGYGKSCVLSVPVSTEKESTNPSVIEKGGVNVSVVHGLLPPPAIAQMKANHSEIEYDPQSGKSLPYFACGISIVIHPRNPFAPTVHANYRYFELTEPQVGDETPAVVAWWFGGGSDLTPSYLFPEDAIHFHTTLKEACDPHSKLLYPAFKTWCDEYFYIPHRSESRGVGGIFFDDLSTAPHLRLPDNGARPKTQEEIFQFVQSCGNSIVPSYLPILQKRHATPYTDHHRRWQLLRRGRYVEFNLVHDRGTKYGLNTPGIRIESVLMSLPETARWEYNTDMGKEGTEEGELMQVLLKPKDWLGIAPAKTD